MQGGLFDIRMTKDEWLWENVKAFATGAGFVTLVAVLLNYREVAAELRGLV